MSIASRSKRLSMWLSQLLMSLLAFSPAVGAETLPSLADVGQVFAGNDIKDMDVNLRRLLDRMSDCRGVMAQSHIAALEEQIVKRAFGLRIQSKDGDYGDLELVLWKASNLKCCATNASVIMAVASYLGDTRLVDESVCKVEFEEARILDERLSDDAYGKCARPPIERSIPNSSNLKACHLKWHEIRNRNTQIRKHRKFVCSIIEPAIRELLTHLDKQKKEAFISEFMQQAELSSSEKTLLGM